MFSRSKMLILVTGMCGLTFLLAPVAHAITITIAEVRGDAAFVKGTDADRKQEIFWEGVYATTAKGKGSFSFEGELPAICVPGDCVGTLTAGADSITVPIAFPPGEPAVGELDLVDEQPAAHGGAAVRAVGFATDGAGGAGVVSGGNDSHLRNWTLELSQQIDRSLPNIIYDLDVSTDWNLVATGEGGWNGSAGADTFRIWQTDGMQLLQSQAPAVGYVYSVVLSPDNEWAIATGFYGELAVHQTSSLQLYDTTATKKKRTRALDFSPDGGLVASASTRGIQLRSFPQDGDCVPGDCQLDLRASLNHSGSWSFSTVFAPYSTLLNIELASATDSGTIKIWTVEDLDTNPTVSVRSVDSPPVYALAWSPDGTRIVAAGDRDISVYDSTDLSILFRKVDAHAGRVNDVAVSLDSSMIVSGGADGALKLWTLPTP
jgi:WD40 repeat protein